MVMGIKCNHKFVSGGVAAWPDEIMMRVDNEMILLLSCPNGRYSYGGSRSGGTLVGP